MTDEAKRCAETCREWYQAFANFNRGDEQSVKDLLAVADLIESLSAELERVKRERDEAWKVVESFSKQNELMGGALEQVKAERDTAIEDLRMERSCATCRDDNTKDHLPFRCASCGSRHSNWQWRGAQEGGVGADNETR